MYSWYQVEKIKKTKRALEMKVTDEVRTQVFLADYSHSSIKTRPAVCHLCAAVCSGSATSSLVSRACGTPWEAFGGAVFCLLVFVCVSWFPLNIFLSLSASWKNSARNYFVTWSPPTCVSGSLFCIDFRVIFNYADCAYFVAVALSLRGLVTKIDELPNEFRFVFIFIFIFWMEYFKQMLYNICFVPLFYFGTSVTCLLFDCVQPIREHASAEGTYQDQAR